MNILFKGYGMGKDARSCVQCESQHVNSQWDCPQDYCGSQAI